jgi:hypothetical protein
MLLKRTEQTTYGLIHENDDDDIIFLSSGYRMKYCGMPDESQNREASRDSRC